METIMVPAGKLRTHEAQMRTRMDLDEMAQLTVQVCQRGMNAHQPILAADNGDGTYRIVSGHRRKLAALFAAEVKSRNGKGRPRVEYVRDVIAEFAKRTEQEARCPCGGELLDLTQDPESGDEVGWCPSCGGYVAAEWNDTEVVDPTALPLADEALCEKHKKVEVPVVVFDGSGKEEILALQASNFGQEEPDLLGQARSFAEARKRGATESEIAANCGETTGHVKAVLALNSVPESLAGAVAAGEAPLGLAVAIAKLKKAQMDGVHEYVREGRMSVEQTQTLVRDLAEWDPPTPVLDPEELPQERNMVRLQAAVWAELEKSDPTTAWKWAAHCADYGRTDLRYLGYQPDEAEVLLGEKVPEASCERCQIRELLQEAKEYYPDSRKYKCQFEGGEGPCMRGVFEGDAFLILVPYHWASYPGVKKLSYRFDVCGSKSAFRKALGAERKAREEGGDEDGGSGSEGAGVHVVAPTGKAVDVAGQRELIRSFMEGHGDMTGARHPLATRCSECKWKLDCSPTKNPDVPHCEWAARRRNVEFKIRVPVEKGSGPEIPMCRQFGPTRSWDEMIPEHHVELGMPREWMLRLMRLMDNDVGYREYGSVARTTCEVLTGRPLGANERNGDWFIKGLEEEIGNLSDKQLATLLGWVAADWMRCKRETYLLALTDGRVLEYRETGWPKKKRKASGEEGGSEEVPGAECQAPSAGSQAPSAESEAPDAEGGEVAEWSEEQEDE